MSQGGGYNIPGFLPAMSVEVTIKMNNNNGNIISINSLVKMDSALKSID